MAKNNVEDLENRIKLLEEQNKENRETLDDLLFQNSKLKEKLNKIWHNLKIMFWLFFGLVACLILIFTTTPPVVIGLWIIFGAILFTVLIFYYYFKFAFNKFE
ncbi:hypothetical protein X928_08670 [Petrotoga miotherma DSM 10691]|uniref:Uncharacterized protein n=2 Tax=Petrotoga TaxID=28236 RepID=A0A2K1P891_9BACT|nr:MULTISPECIES: hypothetical protein [Petrotoga]PNR99015.1 hypothetical protein X928_08670 [Petrotoga miotherma DSM 10691]POZ91966.1 hypothetical protein AA81_09840 [Petrotoga halophila DSM 16923]